MVTPKQSKLGIKVCMNRGFRVLTPCCVQDYYLQEVFLKSYHLIFGACFFVFACFDLQLNQFD
jgi:hypothetical protein